MQGELDLLIRLLTYISHEMDRCQPLGDPPLDLALRAVAVHLNVHYHQEGAPYGDDEEGFRHWVYQRWPAPPAA